MTNTQINDKILELANYLKIDNKCVAHNARLQSIQINGAVIKNFSFKLFNEYKLSFFNCKFLCEINEAPGFFEIENPVYIYGCTFEENVISYNIKFKSNVVIAYCRFNKNFYFKANTFCNSSNFERNFYNYASFKKSHFEKNVTFYNSTFKGLDFSQAIFNENLNIVNTKLNFTFSNLEEKIEQEYEEFNKNKKEEDQKSLDKFANDFRDSFRTFKNALIKDNNLLDASNFHKYELYCKEIELKNKKGKTFKDVVDRWQLLFYRKLCDHHTNLILNLKWFIVIVGFFTSILFGLRYGDGNLMQFFNKDSDLLKMLKNILNIKALNDSNATYLILLYSFIGLFFVRTFFIFYYLVIFILMLAISPYNLFTMINFAIRHETNSFLENIIIIIYTLSIVLIIFSLQKTARKNSIVPS
ncbi:hypothetical protein DSW48_02925 [Campylobacter jejuni]|nr:hypothetical protein [Campylobacter jejuni]